MAAIRATLGALCVDSIQRLVGDGGLELINLVPCSEELRVPTEANICLQIVTLVGGYGAGATALNPTVRVWITNSVDSVRRLAYDQGGGGFQVGFTGSDSLATYRASPASAVNDELLLTIDPDTPWPQGAQIRVEVQAQSGAVLENWYYSFEVIPVKVPAISEVLWITPRKCRVIFDVLMSEEKATSPLFYQFLLGVSILTANMLRVPSSSLSTSWVGWMLSLTGSCYPVNNQRRRITAVNLVAQTITLDPAIEMLEDDGRDLDVRGRTVRTRKLRASISPYALTARLSSEGIGEIDQAQLIQCAYEPLVNRVGAPDPATLPSGVAVGQVADIYWHDDVSYGRMYRLTAERCQDVEGNTCSVAGSYFDFVSPMFGASTEELTLWDLMPPAIQQEDLEVDGQLRKMCVVIEDLSRVLRYRLWLMENLDDPAICPEHLLPHLLYDLANPFRFDLTEQEQRRLALALRVMYDYLGTERGIENILHFFLGIHFAVLPYWTSLSLWVLGESWLGTKITGVPNGECILGPGTAYARNCYEIRSPVTLTTAQVSMVRQIAEWADPANMHLVRITTPATPGVLTSYWILNTSVLGLSTTLAV